MTSPRFILIAFCNLVIILVINYQNKTLLNHLSLQTSSKIESNSKIQNQKSFDKLQEISHFLQEHKLKSDHPTQKAKHLKFMCQNYFTERKQEICQDDPFPSDFDSLGLGAICHKDNPERLNIPRTHNLITDRDRKLIICLPPKAACTTYQRFYLAFQTHNLDYLDPSKDPPTDWFDYIYRRVKRLDDFGPEVVDQVQQGLIHDLSWHKIINTRHPFDRLFSGWKDKFSKDNIFHGDKIHIWSPYNYEAVSWSGDTTHPEFDKDLSSHTINFWTFVKYIVNEDFIRLDEHFKPINNHCSPCDIEYDFVSKSDTLADDMIASLNNKHYFSNSSDPVKLKDRLLMKNLLEHRDDYKSLKSYKEQYKGFDEHGNKIEVKEVKQKAKTDYSRAELYFQQLTKVDPEIVLRLYEKFKWDFILFGFQIESYVVQN